MSDHLHDIIQTAFFNRRNFTKTELMKLLAKHFPEWSNENTLSWKIHGLKTKGIIHHLGRGVYTLHEEKKEYRPEIVKDVLQQVLKHYLIIEVEKDSQATVFNRLIKIGKSAFLNPGLEVFENYIAYKEEVIIVKPLISESPLIEQEGIEIASLEKMLVDCLCDNEICRAQLQEFDVIFRNATQKYTVNSSKIKRNARRRNKITEIEQLVEKYHIQLLIKKLLYLPD
jgi:hypothetical protein